jgi:tetratricopeptide (TPR) repeat protein
MTHPVCSESPFKFGFTGKNSFYSAWSFYYYASGDFVKCILQKENQLENYYNHPTLKKTNEKYFLLVIGNLLSMCYTAGDKSKFLKYYQTMLEEHKHAKENAGLVEEQEIAFTILKFKLEKNTEAGCKYVSENESRILEGIEKYSLIRNADICYNSAIFFFENGDFHDALRWLNRILQNSKIDSREFLHSYSRIVQLILHYELGNFELLNSLLKSTYRVLHNKKQINEFERLILDSMKKLIKGGGAKAEKIVFKELKEELIKIIADPVKRNSIDHFDYLSWLNKKLLVN